MAWWCAVSTSVIWVGKPWLYAVFFVFFVSSYTYRHNPTENTHPHISLPAHATSISYNSVSLTGTRVRQVENWRAIMFLSKLNSKYQVSKLLLKNYVKVSFDWWGYKYIHTNVHVWVCVCTIPRIKIYFLICLCYGKYFDTLGRGMVESLLVRMSCEGGIPCVEATSKYILVNIWV